jgi:hypothetical protein
MIEHFRGNWHNMCGLRGRKFRAEPEESSSVLREVGIREHPLRRSVPLVVEVGDSQSNETDERPSTHTGLTLCWEEQAQEQHWPRQ